MSTCQLTNPWTMKALLVTAALGIWVGSAGAQTRSMSSGSSSGGGFGGSSGGGFAGSSGSGFAGSSGSGFAGSSGSGFAGSTGSGFIGSTGNTVTGSGGYGTSGYSNTGRGSRSGSNQVLPQASDPFQSYYANPMSFGLGTNVTKSSFGTPLFGTINTPTTTYGGTGTALTANVSGFTTLGMRRTSPYATNMGATTVLTPNPAPVPPAPAAANAPPSAMQLEVRDTLDRSSSLTAARNIQVMVNGSTVILRGRVPSEDERLLAEGLVRLTPGVHAVRNELTLASR